MFGSTILEVAIGLVLVYLLLSLTASAINEGFARLLALRSATLQDGIRTLLDDPNNKGIAEAFYKHPLLQNLARDGRFDQLIHRTSKPSYIPANYFRLILLDLPRFMGLPAQTPTNLAPVDTPPTHPADTSISTEISPITELESAISQLPNEALKTSLLLVVRDAGNTLADAEKALEQWFDNSMEHVTGWYKRKVELVILAIGIVLSIVLNIDTINIATTLANDATLRAATVALANETVAAGLADTSDPSTAVTQLTSKIEALGLPIGWTDKIRTNAAGTVVSIDKLNEWPVNWWTKIPGLFLSGIAVSMGAPFWFDLLSKIVNVRATGKKPEEEPKKT